MDQSSGGRFVSINILRCSAGMNMASGIATNSCIIVVMLSHVISFDRSDSLEKQGSPVISFLANGLAMPTAFDIHSLLHLRHTLRTYLCVRHPRFGVNVI